VLKDRAVSVRIAQLLAGVVLGLAAFFLYHTYNAYLEYKVSNEVRRVGAQAAQREAERIDNTLVAINSLAARMPRVVDWLSATRPEIVPVVVCAVADAANASSATEHSSHVRTFRIRSSS